MWKGQKQPDYSANFFKKKFSACDIWNVTGFSAFLDRSHDLELFCHLKFFHKTKIDIMVLSSRLGYTFCTLSRRIHVWSRDSSRPVPAKIHTFLRSFPESKKPSYLQRPPKKPSLKSEAFGSNNGESLYLLVVEVIMIILSPNKRWHYQLTNMQSNAG